MGKGLPQWVGVGRGRPLPQAAEGIPTPSRGIGEGQCSEEGEVTAVRGRVRATSEAGGHRSEGEGAAVPSPLRSLASRLAGFAQTSSGRNGCQACLSPWSHQEGGQPAQLKPSLRALFHPT